MSTFSPSRTLAWSAARLGLLLAGMAAAWPASVAPGQFEGQEVPTRRYRAAFGAYFDGQYRDALKVFQSEGRGAIKSAQTRWIDSICYHAMCGECYYQMGLLPEAMEHYISAIELRLAFADWMMRVDYPALRPGAPSGARERVTWGQPKRPFRPAQLPRRMLIQMGNPDLTDAFYRGGVVEKPQLIGIDVTEIVRCTTLAIRRRTELLGPVCPHDPLSSQLLTTLSQRRGLPNHWSECWTDLELGLAQRAAGKDAQAVATLQRAVAAAGQFDHPLTGAALLELGKLALAQGDLRAAGEHFLEATYRAAYYEDNDLLEEAFRWAALVHVISNPKDVYPPLVEAARWAGRNRDRQLQCSLLLALAENAAVLNQTKQAAAWLEEAGAVLARRDMASGRLGARHAYLSALVRFQAGDLAGGEGALASAMTYLRHGSHWLYQMQLADKLYAAGTITPRTAMDLFTEMLRDPRPGDWTLRPDESLASLVVPHPAPLEHWFEVALQLGKTETALEIGDRIRRHRYFSSQTLGGRLQALRWILEGPEESLDAEAKLHRRDLLTLFPDYEKLRKQAEGVRAELAKAPLAPADAAAATTQQRLLGELATLAAEREVVLHEIALRRQPAAMVFPPLRAAAEIRKALPEGHAMLVFLVARGQIHAFLLNSQAYDHWQTAAPAALGGKIAGLLRGLGMHDANREFTLKELSDATWRKAAEELLALVLRGSKADFATNFKQLVVVPDGTLWYVPFEMLQVRVADRQESLVGRFQIRYAPTAGLGVPDTRGRRASGRTGVALGQLFPRDDPAVARAAFDKLTAALPGTVALPAALPAPSSAYRTLLDRLIVLDDLPPGTGPYDWQPIPQGRGKPGGTLADWMRLPLGGPETIVLPGYHTAAENGLKQIDPATAGQEVFLSACGLMASGARTALVSRWRTGGATSYQLVEEFAQELPHASPAEAWQRAVLLVEGSRVNLEAEPRIKKSPGEDPPKAEHPFFWAGYMLVDSGEPAPQPAPPFPGAPGAQPPAPAVPPPPAPGALAPQPPAPAAPAAPGTR